jgi:O-antigen/teichoic acid export membrane protein
MHGYAVLPMEFLLYTMPVFVAALVVSLPLFIKYLLPSYLPGLEAIQIVVSGGLFASLKGFSSNFLVAAEKQMQLLFLSVLAVLANLVLIFTFLFGGLRLEGASAAFALTQLLSLTLRNGYMMSFFETGKKRIAFGLFKMYLPTLWMSAVVLLGIRVSVVRGGTLFCDTVNTAGQLILVLSLSLPLLYLGNKRFSYALLMERILPRHVLVLARRFISVPGVSRHST